MLINSWTAAEAVLLVLLLATAWRQSKRTQRILAGLGALTSRVNDWCISSDHQVASMDRRMRDVEESAARVAADTQIISSQLADLNAAIAKELELLVHLRVAIYKRTGHPATPPQEDR